MKKTRVVLHKGQQTDRIDYAGSGQFAESDASVKASVAKSLEVPIREISLTVLDGDKTEELKAYAVVKQPAKAPNPKQVKLDAYHDDLKAGKPLTAAQISEMLKLERGL